MNENTEIPAGFGDVVEAKDYVDWKRKTHLVNRHGVIRYTSIHIYPA